MKDLEDTLELPVELDATVEVCKILDNEFDVDSFTWIVVFSGKVAVELQNEVVKVMTFPSTDAERFIIPL
jgi:hypothetical protein